MNKEEFERELEEFLESLVGERSKEESLEAIEKLDYFLGIEPNNVDALTWKALILFEIKNFDDAIGILRKALEIAPENKLVIDLLKDCEELKSLNLKQTANKELTHNNNQIADKIKIPVELYLLIKLIAVILVVAFVFFN